MVLLQNLPYEYALAGSVSPCADVEVRVLDETYETAPVEIFASVLSADATGTRVPLYEISDIVGDYCRANSKKMLRLTIIAAGTWVYTATVLYHREPLGVSLDLKSDFLQVSDAPCFQYEGAQGFLYYVLNIEEETGNVEVDFITTDNADETPTMSLGAREGEDKSAMHVAAEYMPGVIASVGGDYLYGFELCYLLAFVKEHNDRLRRAYAESGKVQNLIQFYNAQTPSTCKDATNQTVRVRGYITAFVVRVGKRSKHIYPLKAAKDRPLTGLYYVGNFGTREVAYTDAPVTISNKSELTPSVSYDTQTGKKRTTTSLSTIKETAAVQFIIPTAAKYAALSFISESPDTWLSRYGFHLNETPDTLPLLGTRVYVEDIQIQYSERDASPQSVTFTLHKAEPTATPLLSVLLD